MMSSPPTEGQRVPYIALASRQPKGCTDKAINLIGFLGFGSLLTCLGLLSTSAQSANASISGRQAALIGGAVAGLLLLVAAGCCQRRNKRRAQGESQQPPQPRF